MRSVIFAAFLALLLAACGGSEFEPYGPALELKMETPHGDLRVDIQPWTPSNKMSPKVWLQSQSTTPPAKNKVTKEISDISKMRDSKHVWFVERGLKKKRHSMLFACDYDGEGEFVRFADAYGPEDVFRKSKGTNTVDQIVSAVADACKQSPRTANRAAIRNATTRPARKGTATSKLKQVLHQEDTGYSGDFYVINEDTYALFNDRWAIVNPAVSLDDFDHGRSRKLEPEKWRRWRKKGNRYELRDPRKEDANWRTINGTVTKVKPLKKNLRLDGKFTYVRTSGSYAFGSSSTWRHYSFDKKGNYESSVSSFGGSGNMSSIFPDMGTYAHASSCDKDGGGSSFSMLHPVVTMGSSTKNENCGDGKTGTYSVRGFTIELHANNGTIQRLPFYRVSKNKIYLGSRGYFRSEDD